MRDIPLSQDDQDAADREAALVVAAEMEAAEVEDFGAFWAAQDRKPTRLRNVFGRDVELPAALPLRFEVEARAAAESRSDEDTKRMVALLFGDDAMDFWTTNGMDIDQFAVLLLWGTANTRAPHSLSLQEALTAYKERVATATAEADLGKAPRTAPGGSGRKSSATGPRSKRTSAANTASRKAS